MLVFDCTTTMLWIILLATLSTATARLYSILTPPNDVIGKLGGVAEFKCEVEVANIPELTWEFNYHTIYSLQFGEEDYPKGTAKYSVERNEKYFILKISDLQYSDGGRYTCRTLKEAEDAHLIVKEVAKRHYIVIPPKDETGKLGSTADFNCVAEFEDIPVLVWEFNEKVIYTLQFYHESYPTGRFKYSVVQDGKTFNLTVKDLQYEDGGKFICRVLSEAKEANLIVTDIQKLSTSTSNLIEGSTVTFTCSLDFTGPSKKYISPDHYPQIEMLIDGKPLKRESEEQELEGSTTFYRLTQTSNITLAADMHGSVVVCEVRNYNLVQANVTTQVTVLYSVRRISYIPIDAQYKVGSAITCTADGNPQPHFMWKGRDTNSLIHGKLLKITKQMAGKNIWRCTANNTVNGHTYHEHVVAVFAAVLPEETTEMIAVSPLASGIDSWKIAVGVTIPICLAISSLIALLFSKRRKKKNNGHKRGKSQNGIPENAPLLDHLDETRLDNLDTSNRLLNLISGIQQDDALTDEVVKEIEDLLPKQGQTFLNDKPLVKLVEKSKYLIGSEKYLSLMQVKCLLG